MPPRAGLSTLELERTRDQLCAQALQLYADEGEAAVSFRRLAERTGTSHTHAYRYFEGKQALFAAMRLRCYQRFAQVIRSADPGGDNPAARLYAIHSGIMAFVHAHPDQYRLMFASTQPPLQEYPQLLGVRRQSFDYLVAVVQQAVDQGRLQGDARDIMHVGWGAVHGLFSLHVAGQLVHERNLEALSWPLLSRIFNPLFENFTAGATPGSPPDQQPARYRRTMMPTDG